MSRIRVLIVEDSGVVREFLRHLVGRDPRLEVVAAVADGEEALRLRERIRGASDRKDEPVRQIM